jgi:hypothetical protein
MGIALIAGAQLMRTNIPIGQVGGAFRGGPPPATNPREIERDALSGFGRE